MPEDSSDDSSIADCCHTELVAIRNKNLLLDENQHNGNRFYHIRNYYVALRPVYGWPIALRSAPYHGWLLSVRKALFLYFSKIMIKLAASKRMLGRDYIRTRIGLFTRQMFGLAPVQHNRITAFRRSAIVSLPKTSMPQLSCCLLQQKY